MAKDLLVPDAGVPAPNSNRKPLQLWHLQFAEWLARQHKHPDRARQVVRMTTLARQAGALEDHEVFDERDLNRVKRMASWKEYYDVIRDGGVRAARRMLKERGQYVVDMHFAALLKAHEAQDYPAVFKGTHAYMQQILPRDTMQQAAAVQVNLTVEQAKVLGEVEAVPVDVEVIDAEPL